MNRLARIAAGLLAITSATGAAPAGRDDAPASYALRVAVTPAPGTLLQRIDLSAAILAAARTPNLDDLRMFDATGRALPIARIAPAGAPPRSQPLRPLPILAPAGDLRVTGLSLLLDEEGRPRLASLSGTGTGAGQIVTAGYLFDTHGIAGEPTRLTLDADLPAGQPVTFTVEAGSTLSDWRTIGERVVYRAPGDRASAIALPLSDAGDASYLRVGWNVAGRLLAPVALRGATLFTSGADAADLTVAAVPPPPSTPTAIEPTAIEFVAPFAVPVTSIQVTPLGGETLVPIRIVGRNDREQPWAALGSGIAGTGKPIAIGDGAYRIFRIEADGAGFAAPPGIRLGMAPRAILFLASGPRPYLLAAGRTGTAGSYLPASALAAGRGAAAVATLSAPVPRIRLVAPDTHGADTRAMLLWAVLLAATAGLASMAWLLWRRLPAS